MARQMTGGQSNVSDATDEIKLFCDELKEDILKKLEWNAFEKYQVLQYKTQLVAGTNYFAKIKINDAEDCIHVKFFQPLPCYKDANSDRNVELTAVQKDKKLEDDIEHF